MFILNGIVPPFWRGLETENQTIVILVYYRERNLSLAMSMFFENYVWITTKSFSSQQKNLLSMNIIFVLTMYVYESSSERNQSQLPDPSREASSRIHPVQKYLLLLTSFLIKPVAKIYISG